jgi:hypothetical protein
MLGLGSRAESHFPFAFSPNLPLHIREFTADKHPCSLRTDRLIVRVPTRNCEDLPGAAHLALTILGDDKCSGECEAADFEGMSVLSPWRSWLQILGFDFREPVRFELRFEINFVHFISPLTSIPARLGGGSS